ncbi:MAG: YbaK/EbsC family protein [Acidimicrobiia bacterium]|nr:YbaK/EbsC family protein [Acidimicrobiia bacterium]
MVGGLERFRAAAEELGVPVEPVRYPAGTRTAADAAAAVGCDVGQIVKSLIFATPTKLVLALTSGANQVDIDRLGELAGEEISLADPEAVRAATGFAIGGTPPFGHLNPLPVWIDEDLLAYDTVWAAAGTPDSCFPITPAQLVAATGAIPADFIQQREREHMGRWLVENMPRSVNLELPDRKEPDRPVAFLVED